MEHFFGPFLFMFPFLVGSAEALKATVSRVFLLLWFRNASALANLIFVRPLPFFSPLTIGAFTLGVEVDTRGLSFGMQVVLPLAPIERVFPLSLRATFPFSPIRFV